MTGNGPNLKKSLAELLKEFKRARLDAGVFVPRDRLILAIGSTHRRRRTCTRRTSFPGGSSCQFSGCASAGARRCRPAHRARPQARPLRDALPAALGEPVLVQRDGRLLDAVLRIFCRRSWIFAVLIILTHVGPLRAVCSPAFFFRPLDLTTDDATAFASTIERAGSSPATCRRCCRSTSVCS